MTSVSGPPRLLNPPLPKSSVLWYHFCVITLLFIFSELMNELVTFAERVPKLVNGAAWKRPEIRR